MSKFVTQKVGKIISIMKFTCYTGLKMMFQTPNTNGISVNIEP